MARERLGALKIESDRQIFNAESALSLTASDRRGPVAHISIGTLGSSGEQIVIPFRTAETVEAGGSDKYLIWAKKGSTDQWSLRLKHNAGVTDLMYQDASYDYAILPGFAAAGFAQLAPTARPIPPVIAGKWPAATCRRA